MATDDDTTRAPLTRSWGHRALIAGAVVAALGAFASAGAVLFAQQQLEGRNLTAIDSGEAALLDGAATTPNGTNPDGSPVVQPEGADFGLEPSSDNPNEPVETFPAAEPAARNILITGADNNSCIDPDSPYAAAFGDREGFGERSDTIMMWRINPATSQVAVLSFPRDLWVQIDGRSSKNRINAAYTRDDPQRLINTIAQNFGILTDHFIQVDFCAFKTMVDAVDGVSVPFERPVRDVNTGLNVDILGPQCFEFDGDHALAYVRSRKLQTTNEQGEWITADGLSDLSRISRQQDFIRRVIDEAIANAFSPSVIRGLLQTSQDYVVTDPGLTPDRILQYAGVLRSIDPATITTYQIEATPDVIGGASVLLPRIGGDNMQAVLSLFRGEATLADRVEQQFDEPSGTTPMTTAALTTVPVTTRPDSAAPIDPSGSAPDDPDSTDSGSTESVTTTTEAVPFETLPVVEAEENVKGLVPNADTSCTR